MQDLGEVSTPCGKATLEKWDDKSVRLLIEQYRQFKHLLKQPKTRKKEVFDKIAAKFKEASDVVVTGEQCLRNWFKLEGQFKKVEDNNKKTGSANKSWKFHDLMDEVIGDSPKVHPTYTFDTGRSSSSSTSSDSADQSEKGALTSEDDGDCDDDDDDDDDVCTKSKKGKTLKNRKRKRKSYSSAQEMLTFLHDWTEKREKAEEEKLKFLRDMQQKKDKFNSEFLDILRNRHM